MQWQSKLRYFSSHSKQKFRMWQTKNKKPNKKMIQFINAENSKKLLNTSSYRKTHSFCWRTITLSHPYEWSGYEHWIIEWCHLFKYRLVYRLFIKHPMHNVYLWKRKFSATKFIISSQYTWYTMMVCRLDFHDPCSIHNTLLSLSALHIVKVFRKDGNKLSSHILCVNLCLEREMCFLAMDFWQKPYLWWSLHDIGTVYTRTL